MNKYFRKEEEFIDKYSFTAYAAARHLGGVWDPNPHANDSSRDNRDYFLKTGQLESLTFMSAAVSDIEGFSVQIALESTKRQVTVEVTKVGTEYQAKTIVDRPRPETTS